jgi:Mlc titration factor MtfA (ptsG expression regulator)
LLNLPSDRYREGFDICIHEFAHAIMNYGFTHEQRQRIQEQYDRSLRSGLWQSAYAATTPNEYWAELSMWYFGARGDRRMNGTPPADGAQGLKDYDPGGYDLLDGLYHAK